MTIEGLHRDSWHLMTLLDSSPGLRALGETLADLADDGVPVAVGTADLKYSNGLVGFERRHPDRFVQFGISEQNMVSAAAGMASAGVYPYVATFASFLALLCCEQIRTDVAYTGLPVRLIGHHAGITLGFYGTSHHACEDLAIMRSIADLNVLAPADDVTLSAALRATASLQEPIYIRIGRGREPRVYDASIDFTLGRAIVHDVGRDLTIFATGSMVSPALDAARALRGEGRSVGVVDVHTIKPLDRDTILDVAASSARLMTVEEHSVLGGLGGAVAELIAEQGAGVPLHRHGIPDVYSLIGPPTHLYRYYGLDADGIAERCRALIDGRAVPVAAPDPDRMRAGGPAH
jgi:transketolase